MKKVLFVIAIAVAVSAFGSSGFLPSAKEKLTDKIHSATVEVSDCL